MKAPTFDDIFNVMSAASLGDSAARVPLPAQPDVADTATKFALALNILLDDLACSAADAKREVAERARVADREQALADVSREFSASTDNLPQLLGVVARRLGEHVGDLCTIRTLTDDGEWLEAGGVGYHRDAELLALMTRISLSGRQRVGARVRGVVESGQPLLIAKTDSATFARTTDPSYAQFLERFNVASSLTVALLCHGKVVGVASLLRSEADRPYDEDDLRFVQSLADSAALAIANARSHDAERAARDAAESNARFQGLMESAPDAMLVTGADGRIILANRQAETVFGYSRAELHELSVDALVPARFRGAHPAHRGDYLTDAKPRGMGAGLDLFGLRKDGTEFPVEISLSPVETADGVLVSSAIRDITDRKLAEEQRSRLAAIVDASGEAIIGKTLDGIITSWNLGACRIFGYEADEMVGKPISLLLPEGRENEEPSILEALAKGDGQRFDTVRRRKDGSLIHVAVTIAPVRDSTGRVIGISKVARDITERIVAEGSLAHAKDRAEAAVRDLEAFSYSVAHDLRAPLRAMNGFARLLLDGYTEKLDAEGADWLHEIILNAGKMGELIDALLSLARVTRSDLHRERVDLSHVVRDVAASLRASEPGRSVEIDVEADVDVEMDARLARVLVENLLGNAWKFTAKTPAPRIAFGALDAASGRAFFFRDNGAGFEMAYASKLFAPFQRLHTISEFPGTGIGLATVQRIVRRHGGKVWAEGAPGAGATVYFTLPEPEPG